MSRQRSLIFWAIPLRKDREHSWKHHARSGSLLYELLGWIDVMAAKAEAETGVRFVFAKRTTLLTKCFKGKRNDKKNYGSSAHLDRVLAELREQHILSEYRETALGVGFVVAPHDSLCHREKNGKTCMLPDRSIQLPDPDFPVSNWRQRVLAAVAKRESKGERQDSDKGSGGIANKIAIRVAVPALEDSEKGNEKGSGQSLYDANFALLTESEKADWLANGMQVGASTRCTRGSLLADEPAYPSYPSAQDELKHHEHFLKSKQRQQQEQPQRQEQVSGVVSLEPTTAEATPKAKQPGRKRDVLPEFEYSRQKDARALEEWKAEIASRPTCSKCGVKHLGDCKGEPYRKK